MNSARRSSQPFPVRLSNKLIVPFVLLAAIGFADSAYLTAQHVRGVVPPCTLLHGCEKVLTSPYAQVAGVPVAVLGLVYYGVLLVLLTAFLDTRNRRMLHLACWLTTLGFLVSAYLVAVQVFFIRALCPYCLVSALTSAGLFVTALFIMRRD